MLHVIALAIENYGLVCTTPRCGLQILLGERAGTLKVMSYAGGLRSYQDTHTRVHGRVYTWTYTHTHVWFLLFSPNKKINIQVHTLRKRKSAFLSVENIATC